MQGHQRLTQVKVASADDFDSFDHQTVEAQEAVQLKKKQEADKKHKEILAKEQKKQEEIRKAEEKRQEELRKAEEKRQEEILLAE